MYNLEPTPYQFYYIIKLGWRQVSTLYQCRPQVVSNPLGQQWETAS